MKVSTSEAFTDSLFPPNRSSLSRTPVDRRYYDFKRPCSQNNTRKISSKKSEKVSQISNNSPERNLEHELIQYKEENKKLKEELESLRTMVKKLLESDEISSEEYKNIYQTIMVDHLQKKVETLGIEANFYRLEFQKNALELDYMKKDKKYIKALAEKYKKLSIDKSIKNSPIKGITSTEISREKPIIVNFDKKITSLSEFISFIEEKNDFLLILSSLAGFLQKTLRAEKVSMILVSEEMKDLYSMRVKTFFRHNWNEKAVIIAEGPNLSQIDVTGLNEEQIKAGFTTGKDLFSTISFNGSPGIYICLKKKLATKGEFNLFTASDFNILNLVTSCASLVIKFAKSRIREATEIEHVLELTSLISTLINNKNHKEFANNVHKVIPKFLEFESAGIIFLNQRKEEFFMMLPSEGSNEKYSNTIVKFAVDVGITGDTYKKQKTIKLDNIKSHRLFNSEIDNCSRSAILNNGIFACLFGIDEKIVGVIQIINKRNGKTITDRDLEKVNFLQKIIGICISCTNCISETSSLTINFKESVQDAIISIDSIDKSKNGSELFEIKNFLHGIKSNMTDWANQKKQKVMAFSN